MDQIAWCTSWRFTFTFIALGHNKNDAIKWIP
uniref:Uncharacterized protein n=1 Tax=Anguilla anguilla TaxID=7936 RepID=A0A0E9QWI4_ANGAN